MGAIKRRGWNFCQDLRETGVDRRRECRGPSAWPFSFSGGPSLPPFPQTSSNSDCFPTELPEACSRLGYLLCRLHSSSQTPSNLLGLCLTSSGTFPKTPTLLGSACLASLKQSLKTLQVQSAYFGDIPREVGLGEAGGVKEEKSHQVVLLRLLLPLMA